MDLTSENFQKRVAEFAESQTPPFADSMLLTDLVVESFVLVEMVIELQEDFNVKLNQEDLGAVKTVGELYAKLKEKQKS